MIGQVGLEMMATLFKLVEALGTFPTPLRAALTVIIPKHKKTGSQPQYRGVGMLPSLYRLWARARQHVA
eukprot:2429565-Pyramimonas_sp.AAC.1